MKITDINFTFKNIAIFFTIIAISILIYKTLDIILIFLISVLIAYILNPIVNFLEKRNIKRMLGVVIIALLTSAIVFLILGLLLPIIIEDIIYFLNNIPEYTTTFFAFVDKILTYFNIEVSLESVKDFISERIGIITKYALNTVTTAAASVKGIVMLILNIVLIPVLVFFLLKDFPEFKNFMNTVVCRLKLQGVVNHLSEFETLIGKYFRGMFFVGIVLSILYTTVLLIVEVKGAFIFGIITGMGGMIPYVGFAVGMIASIIATAIQFQDIIHPIYVLIGFVIVQILESTVITPKIVGNSMGLNPVIVIIALMIGGASLGLIGMILALPIAAFIKILINKYFLKIENKVENDNKNIDNSNNE